ncbi:MAG TPA: polyprenyl diphosphate synthase [Candidatus Anoxymicrobiaceae bacterium]|jgi:undecaprenyl diphosphate synthase
MAAAKGKLKIPPRIAIIMDGNGRWATKKGRQRIDGHREGEKAITDVVRAAIDLKLEALALYAFSTENWKRPKPEVDFLMRFNKELLDLRVGEFHEKNVKIRFLGRRKPIPGFLMRKMDETVELTKKNTGLKLNIAYNYGGQAELVDVMRAIAEEVADDKLKPRSINEKTIEKHLYAPDVPAYDMMIRTAGEMRTSNFLLWELAYAELIFVPTLWPDFRRDHLMAAIEEYNLRTRKFGALA